MQLRDYLSHASVSQPNQNAPWVVITPSMSADTVWRCVLIYYPQGELNADKRHVFVDVLGPDGNLYAPFTPVFSLSWTWEGKRDDELAADVSFDKRPPEPLANIPLDRGQHVTCWINGDVASDRVGNLRSDPPVPDEPGNSLFHKSTYVVFQLVKVSTSPTLPPTLPSTLEQRIAALERRVSVLENGSR